MRINIPRPFMINDTMLRKFAFATLCATLALLLLSGCGAIPPQGAIHGNGICETGETYQNEPGCQKPPANDDESDTVQASDDSAMEMAEAVARQFKEQIAAEKAEAQPASPGTITVRLYDKESGIPISGAKVFLYDEDLIEYYVQETDAQGIALIRNETIGFTPEVKQVLEQLEGWNNPFAYYILQDGAYVLLVLAPSYRPEAMGVDFALGENSEVSVGMQKETGQASLSNPENGKKTLHQDAAYFAAKRPRSAAFERNLEEIKKYIGTVKLDTLGRIIGPDGRIWSTMEMLDEIKKRAESGQPLEEFYAATCCFCVYDTQDPNDRKDCLQNSYYKANGLNNCRTKTPVSTKNFTPEFLKGYKSSCTDFRFVFNYHGPKCEKMGNLVEVCASELPESPIHIRDVSCRTFSNKFEAISALAKAQKKLYGKGKITIVGNQSNGLARRIKYELPIFGIDIINYSISRPECSVVRTIVVTPEDISAYYNECVNAGNDCAPPDESVGYTCLNNDEVDLQLCCPTENKRYATGLNGKRHELGEFSEPGGYCKPVKTSASPSPSKSPAS